MHVPHPRAPRRRAPGSTSPSSATTVRRTPPDAHRWARLRRRVRQRERLDQTTLRRRPSVHAARLAHRLGDTHGAIQRLEDAGVAGQQRLVEHRERLRVAGQRNAPSGRWKRQTKSIASRTVGHIRARKSESPVTRWWCHTRRRCTRRSCCRCSRRRRCRDGTRWATTRRDAGCAPTRCRPRPPRRGIRWPSAIADSTWSHGSVFPPGNHGSAPDRSCIPAMAAPVAAT